MAPTKKKKKKRNPNTTPNKKNGNNTAVWVAVGVIALCAALIIGIGIVRSKKAQATPAASAASSPADVSDSLVIEQGDPEVAQAIAEDNETLEDAMSGFTDVIHGVHNGNWEGEGQSDESESVPHYWTGIGNWGGWSGNSNEAGPTPTPRPVIETLIELPPIPEISFPYTIPGTGLTIEQVSPYSGYYLEDGSSDAISNVSTIVLKNDGGDLSFAGIGISQGERNLAFSGSNIPANSTVIIQEQNRAAYMDGLFYSATATTTAGGRSSSSAISVTDNGDNTFTVSNVSGESISSAVISYKSYLPEEDVYVGGITYTVNLDGLDPDASIVVNSSHYVSGYSVIISTQTN